jgi:hypothetical protein
MSTPDDEHPLVPYLVAAQDADRRVLDVWIQRAWRSHTNLVDDTPETLDRLRSQIEFRQKILDRLTGGQR